MPIVTKEVDVTETAFEQIMASTNSVEIFANQSFDVYFANSPPAFGNNPLLSPDDRTLSLPRGRHKFTFTDTTNAYMKMKKSPEAVLIIGNDNPIG